MAKSLQDILKRRQQEEFVGRKEQLIFFRRNLGYEPDDDRRRFVINISGQGGVGKTWLLRRFRKIAEEFAAVTAHTDETEDDVPAVMGRIAEQFDARHPLKTFAERYKVYRQRRQEIEAAPDAPQGFPAFLGRTLAKGGIRLARRVPIGGVAADLVDEDAFASLAGDFASYVACKIGNKDEVRLVLKPVKVLTPLFLADLQEVAEKHPIALFSDAYERTGDFLDPWLRDLLEGRHGDVPANIVLVIAGRDELDRNHWAPYEGLLARLPLRPFTEKETRDYLARKEITDEQVVDVILHLSGRLPLLVATLAAESPDDPAKVGDPSGEAVERFLKWVRGPEQRQVALDAALPRWLNQDVLAVLVGEKEADALFAWLREMPFVEKRGDGWAYHEVVRAQMLRHKRQESPQGWADLHGRLAGHYEGLRDDLGLEEEAGRKDEHWQRYSLEALYHRLCQAPQKHLPAALNDSLFTQAGEAAFSLRWSDTICTAGADAGADGVQGWGQRLAAGIKAFEDGRHQAVVEMFTALLKGRMLDTNRQARALAVRGVTYRRLKRYKEALIDFDRAIELAPDYAWAVRHRGATYRSMRCYDKALADFNRAIALSPDYAWDIATRGVLYLQMRRYHDALADLDRAIELESELDWAISGRGEAYRGIGRYDDALVDFNRAIELAPRRARQHAGRGMTYLLMGRCDDALIDFNQAIEKSRRNTDRYLYGRALAYYAKGQTDKAQDDLGDAIQRAQQKHKENPKDWRNTLRLALYHLASGEAREAERLYRATLSGNVPTYRARTVAVDLKDFLALFPNHPRALAMRDLLQAHLQEAEQ
jgi:tetratricopeptide (TPR) repeat protein